jgi:hypothetical protein
MHSKKFPEIINALGVLGISENFQSSNMWKRGCNRQYKTSAKFLHPKPWLHLTEELIKLDPTRSSGYEKNLVSRYRPYWQSFDTMSPFAFNTNSVPLTCFSISKKFPTNPRPLTISVHPARRIKKIVQ